MYFCKTFDIIAIDTNITIITEKLRDFQCFECGKNYFEASILTFY